MSKIGDEIRKWCDLHWDGCSLGDYIDEDGFNELRKFADRIDAETVELPRDRDGVPIHVGDTVYLDDGRKAKVARIQLSEREHSIGFTVCGDFFALWPEDLTHTRPDSWERIADEIERYANDSRSEDEIDGMTASTLVDFAERIRKLAEREDERCQ